MIWVALLAAAQPSGMTDEAWEVLRARIESAPQVVATFIERRTTCDDIRPDPHRDPTLAARLQSQYRCASVAAYGQSSIFTDQRPMPIEADPALGRYAACVQDGMFDSVRVKIPPTRASFVRTMDEILGSCRGVRARAIDEAIEATVAARRFSTREEARVFLTTRMAEIDELFRSAARDGGNRDNRAPDQ